MADIDIFALTPAVALQGIIDFKSVEGRKLYETATNKLDEELYDCKPDGLYQFLHSLSIRAQEYGWNNPIGGILHVPREPDNPNSDTNYLIDNYGMVSLRQILLFERTYVNLPMRPAQDNYMIVNPMVYINSFIRYLYELKNMDGIIP